MISRKPTPGGWAAVSDFDGTITLRDVGDHLLLHYGFSDRKTIEESYSLKVRVEDFMKRAFAGAKLTEKVIAGFVREKLKRLNSAARSLGSRLEDPYMAMSFLTLPPIPELKITDRGLIDAVAFKVVPLFL